MKRSAGGQIKAVPARLTQEGWPGERSSAAVPISSAGAAKKGAG